MKRIHSALREIEISLRSLTLFNVIIKTLVILMVSYLLLFMIGLNPNLSLIPSFAYFISSFFVESKVDKIRRVEKKYPMLNEELRTARDHKNEENIVLKELEEDVVRDLKTVELSTFFSYSKSLILVLLLVLAISSSLYIASSNIRILDFNNLMDTAMKRFISNLENNTGNKSSENFLDSQESIMEVGNERIQVEINPVGTSFDFKEVSDTGAHEFSTSFPKDVFLSSAAAYENEFTEEQQQLIKNYFEKVKNK
jgi:hypothetical protein